MKPAPSRVVLLRAPLNNRNLIGWRKAPTRIFQLRGSDLKGTHRNERSEPCLLILAAILFIGGSAMAGKRSDVMVTNNGYPSEPHYNFNTHGKDIKKAWPVHHNKSQDIEQTTAFLTVLLIWRAMHSNIPLLTLW